VKECLNRIKRKDKEKKEEGGKFGKDRDIEENGREMGEKPERK
jgi:hypothetical protein